MSTTTSIFTFDHGQKKLNKAIGVEESYLDDLQEKMSDTLKDYLFDEDRNIKDDLSPSMLVEKCLHNYSYNQLVIMASFFLQHKLEDFSDKLEKKMEAIKSAVTKISLNADDVPPEIKEFLDAMENGDSKDNPIDARTLPPEVKKFLDGLIKGKLQEDTDNDGDDD